MALARKNPLAPGVYWIDVFKPSPAKPQWPNGDLHMQRWLKENTDVVIASVEREVGPSGTIDKRPQANPQPFRDFWIFQVLSAPTDFPFRELGFPTIRKLAAPADVTPADTAFKSDDVVQKPPPEPMFDFGAVFQAALGDAGPWLILGGLILLSSQKGNK